jgi:hypothetical protein
MDVGLHPASRQAQFHRGQGGARIEIRARRDNTAGRLAGMCRNRDDRDLDLDRALGSRTDLAHMQFDFLQFDPATAQFDLAIRTAAEVGDAFGIDRRQIARPEIARPVPARRIEAGEARSRNALRLCGIAPMTERDLRAAEPAFAEFAAAAARAILAHHRYPHRGKRFAVRYDSGCAIRFPHAMGHAGDGGFGGAVEILAAGVWGGRHPTDVRSRNLSAATAPTAQVTNMSCIDRSTVGSKHCVQH